MNAKSPADDHSHPLSLSFKTEEIPSQGINGVLTATDQERTAVAHALDLANIASLTMEYELVPIAMHRFRLKVHLKAAVTQHCVVTLEPVESAIEERLEIELWPADQLEEVELAEDEDGVALSLDGPEPILEGSIDIGQLAYELLAAALDPYPRKADAKFEWHDPHAETKAESGTKPFAELGNLLREKDKAAR